MQGLSEDGRGTRTQLGRNRPVKTDVDTGLGARDLLIFWLAAAGYLLLCAASWALVVLAVLWVLP